MDADIHRLSDTARIRIHQLSLGEAVLRYVLQRISGPRILPFPSQGLQGLLVVIHDDLINRIATGTTVLRTFHRYHDPPFEPLQNIGMPPVVDLRILGPSVVDGVHGHELGLILIEPIRHEYGNEILVGIRRGRRQQDPSIALCLGDMDELLAPDARSGGMLLIEYDHTMKIVVGLDALPAIHGDLHARGLVRPDMQAELDEILAPFGLVALLRLGDDEQVGRAFERHERPAASRLARTGPAARPQPPHDGHDRFAGPDLADQNVSGSQLAQRPFLKRFQRDGHYSLTSSEDLSTVLSRLANMLLSLMQNMIPSSGFDAVSPVMQCS